MFPLEYCSSWMRDHEGGLIWGHPIKIWWQTMHVSLLGHWYWKGKITDLRLSHTWNHLNWPKYLTLQEHCLWKVYKEDKIPSKCISNCPFAFPWNLCPLGCNDLALPRFIIVKDCQKMHCCFSDIITLEDNGVSQKSSDHYFISHAQGYSSKCE